MCYMKQINLRVDEEMLGAIDRARDRVPREVWIRDAVQARLRGARFDADLVRAPEPAPSKPLPPTRGGNASSAKKVTDLTPPPTGPAPGAKKEKPVTKPADVIRQGCEHPRSARQVHGWGTLCGICGVKVG